MTPEQLLAIQRLIADLYGQLSAAEARIQELELANEQVKAKVVKDEPDQEGADEQNQSELNGAQHVAQAT